MKVLSRLSPYINISSSTQWEKMFLICYLKTTENWITYHLTTSLLAAEALTLIKNFKDLTWHEKGTKWNVIIKYNYYHLITRERLRLDMKEDSLMIKTMKHIAQRWSGVSIVWGLSEQVWQKPAADSGVADPALQERKSHLQKHVILYLPSGRISFSPRKTLKRDFETYGVLQVSLIWRGCH